MLTPSTTPTLAELVARQQERPVFAFSLYEESRVINRLRAVHAKQVTQLDSLADLMAETSPDMILRAADGREMVLRLPSDEMRSLCCSLREVLEFQLRKVEERIVEALLETETFSQMDPSDLRPAILALCQPTPPQVAAQPAERPAMEVAGAHTGGLSSAA